MFITQFVELVMELRIEFPFSVTSWIRTPKHNLQVGGVDDSYHLFGLGLDIVFDDPKDIPPFKVRAAKLGLKALDEGDHIHLQPIL